MSQFGFTDPQLSLIKIPFGNSISQVALQDFLTPNTSHCIVSIYSLKVINFAL